MRIPHPALSFVAALGLAACASSTPAPTPAPTPATGPSATPAAHAPGAFAAMSHDQQLNLMKTVVRPNMGKVFQDFDGKKFGDFGCATCHGEHKEDPHKALPKLKLSDGGFEKLSTEKPVMMKFMAEKVVPAMAAAMGEKPFDPATHQGFGCGGCHAVQ